MTRPVGRRREILRGLLLAAMVAWASGAFPTPARGVEPGTPAADFRVAVIPPPQDPLPPVRWDPRDLDGSLEAGSPAPDRAGPGQEAGGTPLPPGEGWPEDDAVREPGIPREPPATEAEGSAGDRAGPAVAAYPVVVNGLVESLIDHFTARERDRFTQWLARSGRYLDMIRRIFRSHGLPEELAYTAMIESGFSPRAVSRVGAKGLWQFMEATARRYGLVITRWVDERLDPVKSTVAAARYLSDLYGMFGHWFLAQAAYNAGEARVARAVQRARTADFWALTQTRHLPDETKLFVPQILAATVITRTPERYGFDVVAEAPLAYDEVTVRVGLDLETVARLAGVPVETVRELNPALRTGITPPVGSYDLRLPPGTGPGFERALDDALRRGAVTTWVVRQVGRGQRLQDLARVHGVSAQRLAEVNQLAGRRLRHAGELVVPVVRRPDVRTAGGPGGVLESPSGGGTVRQVVVRRGDTLWSIATRHGLSPQTLARLNGRDPQALLYPGERLRLDP